MSFLFPLLWMNFRHHICCQVMTFTMGSSVDRLNVHKCCKILEFHFSHDESNIVHLGAKTVEEYQNMFRCYLVKIDLLLILKHQHGTAENAFFFLMQNQ